MHLITTSSPTYGTLRDAMAISLERVAIGFAIGGGFGLVLAIVAGLSRFGENTVDPIMQALRMLPLFGLIPVFIVWFGIGEAPKITLIALGAAIPLYLNTFAGIRGVDGKLAELGKVLGLRRSEMIRHVVLPRLHRPADREEGAHVATRDAGGLAAEQNPAGGTIRGSAAAPGPGKPGLVAVRCRWSSRNRGWCRGRGSGRSEDSAPELALSSSG